MLERRFMIALNLVSEMVIWSCNSVSRVPMTFLCLGCEEMLGSDRSDVAAFSTF